MNPDELVVRLADRLDGFLLSHGFGRDGPEAFQRDWPGGFDRIAPIAEDRAREIRLDLVLKVRHDRVEDLIADILDLPPANRPGSATARIALNALLHGPGLFRYTLANPAELLKVTADFEQAWPAIDEYFSCLRAPGAIERVFNAAPEAGCPVGGDDTHRVLRGLALAALYRSEGLEPLIAVYEQLYVAHWRLPRKIAQFENLVARLRRGEQ